MNKILKNTAVLLLLAIFAVYNFCNITTAPKSQLSTNILFSIANANAEGGGGGSESCWKTYTRDGYNTELICSFESNGNTYECKHITDLSDVNDLSTCNL